MIRQGSRVLRKLDPHAHDFGRARCPFVDEGDVVTMLDDGRALVRWRLSGKVNAERIDHLTEWVEP